MSVSFCEMELNMSQPSVVDWNHYMREICVWKTSKLDKKIGGPGLQVEIYEPDL